MPDAIDLTDLALAPPSGVLAGVVRVGVWYWAFLFACGVVAIGMFEALAGQPAYRCRGTTGGAGT
jgi:hypothetical protein